ncbi:LysR family transcriptional regulator [Sphingosinicella sp. LHD-64]|uniref:LysR family transcriptional regulator n=1 Tax=Sphingosinicella sp. LHD-64 TaxID=3072139 RepID=UPI00280C7E10|nr:LysR family transcriptional regulator [Sphingosinicella sp. LHD-64]MDQ8758151.1 LysR family transcriptional regulator [Sphingosinicella sp. LHD-64]
MDFRQLELFVAVAEELHFGRAAARIGMAQPPFSYQIRRLEDRLGATLLDRTSRKVTLTPAGAQLLREAYGLLGRRAEIEMNVRRAGRGETGTLRIGFGASAAFGILPDAVRRFRARYPDVALSLHGHDVAEVPAALSRGLIDVAFVRAPVTHVGVVTEPLCADPFMVALPSDHPRAGETCFELASLADEPFVFVPRRVAPDLHDLVIAQCRKAGFPPRVVQEAVTWLEVMSCVAAGFGITINSRAMSRLWPDHIVFRDLDDFDATAEQGLAYLDSDPSETVANFRADCRAVAQIA